MKTGKIYTEEELIYLEASWGKISVSRIAKKLGRTEKAVESKAWKMKLGNPLESKDYLIATEVAELIGTDRHTLKKHLEKRGLKHKIKTLKNRKLITVNYDDLLQWLIENTKYWNGTKVDKLGLLILGMDRDFLSKKIVEDEIKIQRTTLNEIEIEKIKRMYKKFITYQEIADILKKEYQTVKWKIHTLIENGELKKNSKEGRIVRSIKRQGYGWEAWQDEYLMREFKNGKTLREISEVLGKNLETTKSRNRTLTKRIIKGLAI